MSLIICSIYGHVHEISECLSLVDNMFSLFNTCERVVCWFPRRRKNTRRSQIYWLTQNCYAMTNLPVIVVTTNGHFFMYYQHQWNVFVRLEKSQQLYQLRLLCSFLLHEMNTMGCHWHIYVHISSSFVFTALFPFILSFRRKTCTCSAIVLSLEMRSQLGRRLSYFTLHYTRDNDLQCIAKGVPVSLMLFAAAQYIIRNGREPNGDSTSY